MQAPTHSSSTPSTDDALTDHWPSQLLLSLTVAPMIVGLMTSAMLANFCKQVGEASEELFRGDRLPILNRPTPPKVQ